MKNIDDIRKEKKVTLMDIAELIHVKYQTVSSKINGDTDFTFDECVLIHENFFKEYDFKYLFSKKELQE